ncbi:MAG: magnesium-translocating P-type ATPase [Candidatus Diapherotrites archaeon]|nr:magnesium-translocating P-type ATPase [Candidatus Diapherotrites archaeon]
MPTDFSAMQAKAVFEALDSSEKGLSAGEAGKRLEKSGKNEIQAKDRRTALSIFISQFTSPLILILVLASLVAFFLGEGTDALIIIGIVFVNALLGFYQEFRSEKALAELRKYVSFKAKVLRDGQKTEIDARDVVTGDIVFLGTGDLVPADLRLLEAQELSIDESVVTGESFPVHKHVEKNLAFADSSKKANIAFMGTIVSGGLGKGIVTATGKETEFGHTAVVLSAKEPPTDFQESINSFGNLLVKIIFLMCVFIFASNAFLGKGLLESFLFAVAIAVGITPELLPIIITISLSNAAIHLAKKKVVVKKLISIEDLGNVDVLCMDKTGTLTENSISVENCSGVDWKESKEILEFAVLCNSAVIEKGVAKGNAIDSAILDYANKANFKPGQWEKIEEIEFDYSRRRMSVVLEKGGKRLLVCKGAPESVFEKCGSVVIEGKEKAIRPILASLKEKAAAIEKKGLRVVAVSFKEIGKKKDYSAADEEDLALAGFVSFIDPPKKTALEALRRLKALGVEFKILTGDNELVTMEICRQVGLEANGGIVLGSELEKMDEAGFMKAVCESTIFARITPEQKYRIVKGLGEKGHIVGFLGDGVNDAPALKAADVGITVDTAVDIAKDSADIILLRKSLGVLVDGIEEGRKTFGNIRKYIYNTISANFGNMFTLSISSLFLNFIPLLPSQILLANFISDGPLLTISTDNVDSDSLHKPRRWNIKAIRTFMLLFGSLSMVFDFITIGILMLLVGADFALFRTAWFLESVLSEIVVTFAIRTKKPFWKSKPSKMLLWASVAGIIVSVALVYSPLAFLFQFKPLPLWLLAAIAAVLAAYFSMAEIAKTIFFKGRDEER